MVNTPSRIHQVGKKKLRKTKPNGSCMSVLCHVILRARKPAGVHEGVLHERVEAQYLRIHGSERLSLNGELL